MMLITIDPASFEESPQLLGTANETGKSVKIINLE